MTLRRKLHLVHAIPNGLTIHSRGGIGNQLFCLFAGLALADKLECRLYIDPSQHRHTAHLPFLVDQLGPEHVRAFRVLNGVGLELQDAWRA